MALRVLFAGDRLDPLAVAHEGVGQARGHELVAAMRAHATQITVDGEFFALSNDLGQRALGIEYFTLLAGPRGPGDPYERDLFARAPVQTR